jgi:hypothetical protein
LTGIECTRDPLRTQSIKVKTAEELIVKIVIVGFDGELDDFLTQFFKLCIVFERLDIIGK